MRQRISLGADDHRVRTDEALCDMGIGDAGLPELKHDGAIT
ncbi:hypothetical protein [Mycobacterium sp. E1386]|nr:hypothetical protein [Mycobacterium sp. E1386]